MVLIRKVWKRKVQNKDQLLITIPNDNDIEAGDYVKVDKVGVNYETGR